MRSKSQRTPDEDKSPPLPRSLSEPPIRSSLDPSFKTIVRDIKLKCESKTAIFTTSDAEIVSEYAILKCCSNTWNVFVHNDEISIIVYKSPECVKHSVFAKGCVIGKGQEGTVYLGQDLTAKRVKMVAIKERLCVSRLSIKDCANEYKILESLTYAKGFFAYDTIYYIFMSHFPGFSAIDIPKTWSDDLRQAVASGMLRALRAIHKSGILHGDIKPDNFIIEHQLSWVVVKLVDFGQSVFMNSRTNKMTGAPAYQPPECLLDDPPLRSQKTEFYSLAICQLDVLSCQSFWTWQCNKGRFDPYMHDDLEKCCYDVFLSELELNALQKHNVWRYEMLKIAHRMHVRDINDRADVNEVADAINIIDKHESEYIKKLSKDADIGKILAMRKKRTMQKLDLKEIYKSPDIILSPRESSQSPKSDSSRSTSSGPQSGSMSPIANSPTPRHNMPSSDESPHRKQTQPGRKRRASLVLGGTK